MMENVESPRKPDITSLQPQEPISLLYQDLDDVEQTQIDTLAVTMDTSIQSERSGKDAQLTHFIEKVNVTQ